MKLARVAGTVVATRHDVGLNARRLVVIEPLDAHGVALGTRIIAVDAVNAREGEVVIWVGGKEATWVVAGASTPTDCAIWKK